MDEYVNLPRDHPESYHHYMFNNFFKVSGGLRHRHLIYEEINKFES